MNWTPWRKTQSDPNVPEEVRDYYQSEKRQRVGVAWLLALGTLIVTLVVAALLFLAGRWVYRSVTHKDNKGSSTTASQSEGATNQPAAPTDSSNGTTGTTGSGTNSAGPTTSNGSTGSGSTAPSGSSGAASSQPNNLVNTGPGDDSGF